MAVMLFNKLRDPCDELFDVSERTALDCALADKSEPPFDLIEPAGISWREMRMEPGALSEPCANFGMFVCRVIIHHDVDVQVGGYVGFDMAKEGEELLVPVPGFALADDGARRDIEGSKECGGSMSEIVMSHAFDITETHWQYRLAALESLDLSFLVHTQNKRVFGRIEIQTDDVAHFLDEEGIRRQGETTRPVWLDTEQREVAMNGAFGKLGLARERSRRPMRGVGRALVERRLHKLGDVVIVIGSATMSGWQVVESVNTLCDITSTPIGNGGIGDFELRGDVAIGHTVSDTENDFGASRQSVRQAA